MSARPLMSGKVDRGFVKMVCIKRIITGTLSLLCGVGLVVALVLHGSAPPIAGVALLIFFGGGTWTLRDGLRMRRELLRS